MHVRTVALLDVVLLHCGVSVATAAFERRRVTFPRRGVRIFSRGSRACVCVCVCVCEGKCVSGGVKVCVYDDSLPSLTNPNTNLFSVEVPDNTVELIFVVDVHDHCRLPTSFRSRVT